MKWLLVALLWGVALLNYLDRQVIFSLLPLLERDLHASSFQLGLISTVFLWTYGILSPFGGYVADRFGKGRVILGGLVIWSIATWVTGHVTSMSGMLGSRALMGASEAFYLPAALALIADRHGPATRSLATGIHQSGLYTGLVLGGAWGGWMGEHSGWRPVFDILGVIGVVYFIVLLIFLRRDNAPQPGRFDFLESIAALFRTPGFAAILVAFTSMAMANWLIYTWLPLYLFDRFHMSLSGAGFSATFYIQAASYAGVIAGGILTDRWAKRNPQARVICQMTGLAIAAPFLAILSLTGSMPVLIIALITFGLGRGLFDCTTMPVLREIASPKLSATGYGLFNLGGALVGGVGAAVAGSMRNTLGLGGAFQFAALVLLVGVIALNHVRRKARALVE